MCPPPDDVHDFVPRREADVRFQDVEKTLERIEMKLEKIDDLLERRYEQSTKSAQDIARLSGSLAAVSGKVSELEDSKKRLTNWLFGLSSIVIGGIILSLIVHK